MKKQTSRLLICLGYLLLFVPFIYSIYFSMPANDDFALALNWWGKGIVGEAFTRAGWNYMNWFGQSGILAILVQVLFNPLRWFNNSGHSFSICMLIWNAIIIFGILNGVKRITKLFVVEEDNKSYSIITLIVAAVITSADYYFDIYNWWSGFIGYAFLMMFAVQAIAFTFEYYNCPTKKKYICLIAFGMCACTSLMLCVPVGLLYLFVAVIGGSNSDEVKFHSKIIPFICYLIAGITTVAAPGNYVRMDSPEAGDASVVVALVVAFYVVLRRCFEFLIMKTWITALLIIAAYIGFNQENLKITIKKILIGFVCIIIAAFGAILPYVYGQAKTFDSEFAPRAYYIMDYVLLIGFTLLAVSVGQFLRSLNKDCNGKKLKRFTIALIVICTIAPIVSRTIKTENHVAIFMQRDVISHSYEVWNDILDEIEASDTGTDVVVKRDAISWCRFFYNPGIDDQEWEPITEKDGYANCNQSVAKYYGVNKVTVVFE